MDYRGEWHVAYECDLVKYAAVVENKYGVEVLLGCGDHWIMNIFYLNNGERLTWLPVPRNATYEDFDRAAVGSIEWWESIKS